MKRIISAAITVAGLTLGTLALAQPAQAITNPADNPRPITVKGDDGKTYTDGEDTLPGYDDEACTYIPGASFDFANNKVRYADGQSITWTEWDRATGYKEWKAQQNKPAPAPAPTAKTTAPKPAKTTAPKPAKTTAPKPKATAKPTAAKSSATPSATPTTSAASDDVAAADATTPASDAAPTDAAATDAAPAAEPSDSTEDVTLAAESTDTKQASSEAGSTGSAGLLILGGLAGAGILAVAGYSVAARGKGSAS